MVLCPSSDGGFRLSCSVSGTAVIVSVVLDQLTLLNHFLSLLVVIIIIIFIS